jgi:hypothetical protein
MIFPAATLFLLFLYVSQIVVETIKTLRPKFLVVRHPIGDVLKRRGSDSARPPLRFTPARNLTGVFQYLEMPGNGGHAHRKGSREFRDRGLPTGKTRKDGAPGRVGESGEGGAKVVRHSMY